MKELLTDNFKDALRDYYYFLEKAYPQKAILKIVGDRYALDKSQRTVLYRGIFSASQVLERKSKKTKRIDNKYLYIDTYNVFFTIANYLFGRLVFISNDTFLRDTGEVYGKIQTEELFYKAIDLFFDYIKIQSFKSINFFIDAPLSYSGELAVQLNKKINDYSLQGEATTVKSPDYELKQLKEGIIATSDSAVIDDIDCNVKVIDIAGCVIEKKFSPKFIDFGKLV